MKKNTLNDTGEMEREKRTQLDIIPRIDLSRFLVNAIRFGSNDKAML